MPQPRLAFVDFGAAASPGDLVAPARPEDVFTEAERRHCGASIDRWAGRLAAKQAVLESLGLDPAAADLSEVEVVPGPHEGQALPHLCELGHRPVARLHGRARDALAALGLSDVELSISHADGLAVALASPH